MDKKKALFITIVDHKIGFGHFNRTHTLAKEALNFDWDIEFLVLTDIKDINKFFNKRFSYFIKGSDIINSLKSFIKNNLIKRYEITLSDIVYIDLFKDYLSIESIFNLIQKIGIFNCSIDSFGRSSLYKKCSLSDIDCLIIPYLTNKSFKSGITHKIISGNKFIILSNDYNDFDKRIIADIPKKVLVTCGGSDPQSNTQKIIHSLNHIDENLKIEVIVGPLFSRDNYEEIIRISNKSFHTIKIIKDLKSLYNKLVWSDITISASGLTKYEIAATGTPSILFSIDNENYLINEIFKKYNCFIDIGIGINQEKFILNFKKLFLSKELRISLSKNSRKVVDGKGCFRILKTLNSKIS